MRGVQRLYADPRLEIEARRKDYLARYVREASRLYGLPRFYTARELSYDLKGARDVNILYAITDMVLSLIHI